MGPGRGWNVSTGGVLCLSLFDRFVPMHSAVSSPAFMSAQPGSEGYLLWEDNRTGIGVFGKIYSALSCVPFILLGCFVDQKLETDAIVGCDINALLRLCVSVREAAVGVTPQDCMDHVRGAHDVPSDVKFASLNRQGRCP